MNSSDPIGGFFELELRDGDFLHSNSILLNSGRNCFEYILKASNAKHVYLPKYTCDVMLEPLQKLNIMYTFYAVTQDLEVADTIKLKENEFLIYTNYFGAKDDYCLQLSEEFGEQLILDCSQAYYFEPPSKGHTFYSPRKFFGVSDGGCLFTSEQLNEQLIVSKSHRRMTHLIERIELGPEAAYGNFKQNDKSLTNEPIMQMSRITRRILGNVDFEKVRQQRISNFSYLHERLKEQDKSGIEINNIACPMTYPLATRDNTLREKLISHKIFTPLYWPNVMEWCVEQEMEYRLAQNTIHLPIDQRYGIDDMKKIVEVLYGSKH